MMNARAQKAPFPYFGGKSQVAAEVWARLGRPKQYIEPFCGSAAVLLAAPAPASLEVVNDANFYIANLWRAIKLRPDDVWAWQDYPVSHVDLYARHRWLTDRERTAALRDALLDPEWPGDAQVAGWWLWGQCCWIGSGWCDPARGERGHGGAGGDLLGQIPHAGNAGMGVQAVTLGKVPHASDAGRGKNGQIPHLTSRGPGVPSPLLHGTPTLGTTPNYNRPRRTDAARAWIGALSDRLARVRVVHGDWSRCLNHHYGGEDGTAVFLDPPYKRFEALYSTGLAPVAEAVEAWAREHAHLRVALCGHRGDYALPGWSVLEWDRGKLTYGGDETTAEEAIWFSPPCAAPRQRTLFDLGGGGA